MESRLVCWCEHCGCELYAGEFCYNVAGARICEDCLPSFSRAYFRPSLELLQ
jgi:hypothetical protein